MCILQILLTSGLNFNEISVCTNVYFMKINDLYLNDILCRDLHFMNILESNKI